MYRCVTEMCTAGPGFVDFQLDTLSSMECFGKCGFLTCRNCPLCPTETQASHIRQSSISRFSISAQCPRVPQRPTSGVRGAMCGRGLRPAPHLHSVIMHSWRVCSLLAFDFPQGISCKEATLIFKSVSRLAGKRQTLTAGIENREVYMA
jgi:hypothetical protein